MIVTLLAPTLAIKASFSSGLKETLWAPLSAGMVATTLSVAGSNTCALADFMLLTHTSAAHNSPVRKPTALNRLEHIPTLIILRRSILVLLSPIFPGRYPWAPRLI